MLEVTDLPSEFEEAWEVISELLGRGWQICDRRYDKEIMGNWYIDFSRRSQTVRLIKDRSQYLVEGNAEVLKAAGMSRAFTDVEEFRQAVIAWAENFDTPPHGEIIES